MSADYPIAEACEAIGVSRSGFYAWRRRQRQPGRREQADQALGEQIAAIFAANRRVYGRPRIQRELRAVDQRHGDNRVARLMRLRGLNARPRRGFRPRTTDSRHDGPIAPNRLALVQPSALNQAWVTDITYIATDEGWLYCAAVLDRFSRRCIGWAFADTLHSDLCLRALAMAREARRSPTAVLHHSDRGCQYASEAYVRQLDHHGFVRSMSRQGNCYDNAVMESFWSTLKIECLYRHHFASKADARTAAFDYIESFYNPRRRHSALGYLSPVAFEQLTTLN